MRRRACARGLGSRGIDAEECIDVGTEILGALADVRLLGGIKAMHVCKGNATQSRIADGGYAALSERVFKRAS
jgi:hypothetical protein